MGNNTFNSIKETGSNGLGQISDIEDLITKNCFEKQYVVGKGGFGKVWKVQSKKFSNQAYALKEMQKSRIIARKSLNSVLLERTLLSQLNHPFIINMRGAFQDRETLYLVMDYCSGGDLRYHLPYKYFNEEETRFMVACMILATEYVHTQGIIHRDIKPENLVFDERGYLMLTDFGISRQLPMTQVDEKGLSESSAFENMLCGVIDTSGTPGYMSPEAMCKLPHGPVSDFFAIGIIVYEMMYRKRPYSGPNKQAIRDTILAKQVQIRAHEIPTNWSIEAADFCNKLIRRKPSSRIGFNHGISELKQHPWFSGFDWNALLNKKMRAPWVPPRGDNYKGKNTEFPATEEKDIAFIEAERLVRRDTVQKLFEGFYSDLQIPSQFIDEQAEKTVVVKNRLSLQNVKDTQGLLKKSRNIISHFSKLSPKNNNNNKVNKVNIMEVRDKNFKIMQQINHQYQCQNSNGSTGISSQKSSICSSGMKNSALPKIGSPKMPPKI